MSEKRDKKNYSMTLFIPELDCSFHYEGFSGVIAKLINQLEKLVTRRKVIYSSPPFLEDMLRKYESGEFDFLEINGITDLAEFLHSHFDIRQKTNPLKEISRESLRTLLYQYKNLGLK